MEETPKVKVVMTNDTVDEKGRGWQFQATDFVPEDELDAYITDARTRWNSIVVSNN